MKYSYIVFICMLILLSSSATAITDISNSVLARWSFDTDFDGTVGITDLSTIGTVVITSVDCQTSGCVDFDGSNDFLINSTAVDFNLSEIDNFTINYFIKTDDPSVGTGGFIQGTNENFKYLGLLTGSAEDALQFLADVDGSAGWDTYHYNNTYSISRWTMATLRKNGTNITMYHNGTPIKSITHAGDVFLTNLSLIIGSNTAYTNSFDGRMDELLIYNRSLSDLEIRMLYAANGVPNNITFSTLYPENGTSHNYPTINFNLTLNITYAGNCTLYINDTLNQTGNYSGGLEQEISLNITMDEGHYTFFMSCIDNQSERNTTTNKIFVDTNFPTITWGTPNTRNTSVIVGVFTPNISIADTNLYSYMYNITFLNDTLIYNFSNTTLTGDSIANITHTTDMINYTGAMKAIVRVCDGHTKKLMKPVNVSKGKDKLEVGDIYVKSLTKTKDIKYTKLRDRYTFAFEYDTPTKQITLEVPQGCHYLSDTGYKGHFVCNNRYWIDFEGDYKVTVQGNTVTIDSTKPLALWNFNSIGELNCVTEIKKFFSTNYTIAFDDTSLSGGSSTFYFNLTYNSTYMSSVDVDIWYNNTLHDMTLTGGATLFQFSKDIFTPVTQTDDNITFWFVYTLNNVSANTTKYNQSVIVPSIDNCTTYTTKAINFTIRNDSDETPVKGEINAYIQLWTTNITNIKEFNLTWRNNNTYRLCINPKGSNFTILAQLEYSNTSIGTKTYYLVNYSLDNVTDKINLYLTDDATAVTFTVKDQDDNEVKDVYIHVLKYDFGTNTYTTNEILKSDEDGEAIGNIVLSTQWYKFSLIYLGVEVLNTDPIKITTTTRNFRINLLEDVFVHYGTANEITTSLRFTNDTKNFAYTFLNPTGGSVTACLKVIHRSVRRDTLINESCVTSSSGTILVNIGNTTSTANNLYIATGTISVNPDFVTDSLSVSFDDGYKVWGEEGIYASFFLKVTFAMIGVWNPIVAIILVALVDVFMIIFGLFHMSWGILMIYLLLVGITVFKINQK